MTRRLVAMAALALAVLVIAIDFRVVPPNPYAAPSLFAFGSGVAPSGGFCGAMPD